MGIANTLVHFQTILITSPTSLFVIRDVGLDTGCQATGYGEHKTSPLSLCVLLYGPWGIPFLCFLCLSSLVNITRTAICRDLCTCEGREDALQYTIGGHQILRHCLVPINTTLVLSEANINLCFYPTRMYIHLFYYKTPKTKPCIQPV